MSKVIYTHSAVGMAAGNTDTVKIAKKPLAAGQRLRSLKITAEFSITNDATGAAVTAAIAQTCAEFAFGFVELQEGAQVAKKSIPNYPGAIMREWSLHQNNEDWGAVVGAAANPGSQSVPIASANGTLLAASANNTVYLRVSMVIPFYVLRLRQNPNFWALGQTQANSIILTLKSGSTLPATTHLTYNSYTLKVEADTVPGADRWSNYPRPVRNNSDSGGTVSGPNGFGLVGAWERTEDISDNTGLMGAQITVSRGGDSDLHSMEDGYLLAEKWYRERTMSSVLAAAGQIGAPFDVDTVAGAEDDGSSPFIFLPRDFQLSDIPTCHSLTLTVSSVPSGIGTTWDVIWYGIPQFTADEIMTSVGPNVAKGRGIGKLVRAAAPTPLGEAAKTLMPIEIVEQSGTGSLPRTPGWTVHPDGSVIDYAPPHLHPAAAARSLPGLSPAQAGTQAVRRKLAAR